MNGMEARDSAIEHVRQGADPVWLRLAGEAVARVANRGEMFNTDDVWAELGEDGIREKRAMGAVMKDAQKAGLITPTEQYRVSTRAVCHRNPKRLWVAAGRREQSH